VRYNVFKLDPFAVSQALPRLFDPLEETRIILELIVEPIFIRGESDQNSRGFAVPRYDQLNFFRKAQIL
jgi:hypothetical protein